MKLTWAVLPVVFLTATGWAEASPDDPEGLFSAGVEYGAPYKLVGSARYDVFLTRDDRPALILQSIGSIGLGGGRAGLGLGTYTKAGVLTGRATLVRTFAHPLALQPDRTWVGGEVEWSLIHLVSLQAGVLYPLGGGGPAFTWAVGIGMFDPRIIEIPGHP